MPVLLSAATWTRDCTMTEWITEQLLRSQPNLDVRIRTSTGATVWLPKALAESGLIPVIDGLDELPPDPVGGRHYRGQCLWFRLSARADQPASGISGRDGGQDHFASRRDRA